MTFNVGQLAARSEGQRARCLDQRCRVLVTSQGWPKIASTSAVGAFVAGEMIDWEAPTGGYLLQACFATGRAAGVGAAGWVERGGA